MTNKIVILLGSIEAGDPPGILDRIKNISGILEAQLVYGKHDFVLKAELDCLPCVARSMKEISEVCKVKTLFTDKTESKGE